MPITTIANTPPHLDLANLAGPAYGNRAAQAAILLIHGFTGTPYEMSSLTRPFAADQFYFDTLTLVGHGQHPAQLYGVTAQMWITQVQARYRQLRAQYKQVYVIGLSLGGALARFLFAEKTPPDQVVLLATPWRINDPFGRLVLPLLHHTPIKKNLIWLKAGGSDIVDTNESTRMVNYRWTPFEALCEVDWLLRKLRWHAAKYRACVPTLLIHGVQDHTVPIADAKILVQALGAKAKLLMLAKSYHVLPRDLEQEAVASMCQQFITQTIDWRKLAVPADAKWY